MENITKDSVQKQVWDAFSQEKENFNELEKKAYLFLTKVNKALNKNKQIDAANETISHQLSAFSNTTDAIKAIAKNVRQRMNNNQEITQEMLKLGHELLICWNNFLGRKISIAWVSDTGQILFTNKFEKVYETMKADNREMGKQSGAGKASSQIAEFFTSKAEARFNEDDEYSKYLSNLEKNLEETLIKNHQFFYQSALKRFNFDPQVKWWEEKNGKYEIKQHQNNIKYNKGHIGESYAQLILNNKKQQEFINIQREFEYNFPESKEQLTNPTDIKKIDLNSEKAVGIIINNITLDNVSEIRSGDVVLEEKVDDSGEINLISHFLVKARTNFSTGKIGQYIYAAYNILGLQVMWDNRNNEIFTKRQRASVKQRFEKLIDKHTIDIIYPALNKVIDKKIKEKIENLDKQIKENKTN